MEEQGYIPLMERPQKKQKKLIEAKFTDEARLRIARDGTHYNSNKPLGFVKRHIVISPVPSKEKEIKEIAHEMVEWALLETSFELEDFPVSKLMSPYRFFKIESEYFQAHLELANYIIACRLKRAVREKRLDSDYVYKMLPFHNKGYREWLIEMKSAVKEQKLTAGNFTILLDKIPDSPLVPQRIEEKE